MNDNTIRFRIAVQFYYLRECLSEWMLTRWGYERMRTNRLWRVLQ